MIYENEMKNILYPFKGAIMKGNAVFMNHCHQEVEIIVIRSGRLKVSCEEEFLMQAGDICIIPPFRNHSIAKGSEDCERLVIQFDLKIMGTWTKDEEDWIWIQNELNKLDMYSGHWAAGTRDKIREILEVMYAEYLKKDYVWHLSVKTLVNSLILISLREMSRVKEKSVNKQLSKMKDILEYVALHYCEEIKLQSCADAVGFNPSYLSRFFSERMGVTFQEYIKKLRLEKAKWLLLTEKMLITEICYKSGFQDVKTFNKLFKKEYGVCPTVFRKNAELTE